MLLWGLSVTSSCKCKGFALEKTHLQPVQSLRRSTTFPLHHRQRPSAHLKSGQSNDIIGISILRVRGGAIDSKRLREGTNDNNDNTSMMDDGITARQDVLSRRRGMAAALAATYFTVMASKCALPAVLVQLTSPKIGLEFASSYTAKPQVLFGRLLALSTVAIAAGKLLLGPVIDNFGGIFSLQIALSFLLLLLGTISVSKSFTVFAVAWILVDFIFSSCWAACINAIHQAFPENEWAKRIGMLAAAARTGNAAAFAFFAWILSFASDRMAQPWRVVFVASALIQALPIGLLTYFSATKTSIIPPKATKKKKAKTDSLVESKPQWKSSIAALQREAKTSTFWLHLLSRSVLMVFASFLLFVPLLMSQAYGTSSSVAAQVGSVYALGCLLSVSLGSNLYARLSRKWKAISVSFLLGMSTISSAAQLGHMTGTWTLSAGASAASLFLWGFSFAIPFYIPPSLYALSKGGIDSSATIADVFDIGGFGLLAIFNGYAASIQHAKIAAWIPTFQITTGCAAIALVSLPLAILFDK